MSDRIFSKRVILHIEDDTGLNRIGAILGSTYGSILSGNGFTGPDCNGNKIIYGAACGKVTKDDFLKYPEVVDVKIEDL